MPEVWFTSDTHFGHENCAEWRGFEDAQEHDEKLIELWNASVSNADRVYHLGDFALCNSERIEVILKLLNGQIYFVRGNHDSQLDVALKRYAPKNVVWCKDYFFLKHDSKQVALSHYPFLTWRNSHYGSWHLHGHCHGSLPEGEAFRLDVGVDCHKWSPVNWEGLREELLQRRGFTVDHHNENHYKEALGEECTNTQPKS